jgi:hypothetical protein
MLDNDTQTTLNIIPKNDLKKFLKKAFQHIFYLKIIMFLIFIILVDYKLYSEQQLFGVIFIILFNIAFVQNMMNNLSSLINTETKLKID